MNFQEIEKLKVKLSFSLPNIFGKTKLFSISSFYSAILATDDKNIIEAYSPDLITEYLSELKLYTPFYHSPEKTVLLLSQLEKLKCVSTLSHFENEFAEVTVSIKQQLDLLNNILEGQISKTSRKSLRFPLIESTSNTTNTTSFGSIESVNIKIHKAKNNNHFVFVPSGNKIEERLLQQAQISLEIALNYLSKHKHKFHKHHEVLIYFENLSANYEGNSLGVALTIGFIEQLSLLYNLPYITHVMNKLAATGGVNNSGKVIHVGKEIIESKTEAVFFSDIESFVVPKEDENAASAIFTNLIEKYPNRGLSIVTIADIKDFINRRDLVDIKKRPRIIRTVKSLKNNWIASLLSLLLTLILIFIYVRDLDDNPAIVRIEGSTAFIANNKNNVIFKYQHFDIKPSVDPSPYIKLVDINNDGTNEVLSSHFTVEPNNLWIGKLACLDNKKMIQWEFTFDDIVISKKESLKPPYDLCIIDTVTIASQKRLVLFANNRESYAGAVFFVDLKNGKRVGETFWQSGHFSNGIVYYNKNNSIPTLVLSSINNDIKRIVIISIPLNKINGQFSTNTVRSFYGIEKAKFTHATILPNSDLSLFQKQVYSSVPPGGLSYVKNENVVRLVTLEDYYTRSGIIYNFNDSLFCKDLFIMDGFSSSRDSLVIKAKLSPPLTDTREYKKLIKQQIKYWNGKEFVNRLK